MNAPGAFLLGLFVGIALVAIAIILTLRWIIDPATRLTKKESYPPNQEKQDPNNPLRDYLARSLSPLATDYKVDGHYVGTTFEVDWVNIIVTRWFLALKENDKFKTHQCKKLTEKMNAKLKSSILLHIEITDLDLGDHAPKMVGVRFIKELTSDYAVTSEVDTVYKGGASIQIQATLTGDLKVPVRVYLNELAGKLRIRWPSIRYQDRLGISFVQDPGVTFTIDAPLSQKISDTIRQMVNQVLGTIVRKVFLEMCVLPAWREIYMPLMVPIKEKEESKELPLIERDDPFYSTLGSTQVTPPSIEEMEALLVADYLAQLKEEYTFVKKKQSIQHYKRGNITKVTMEIACEPDRVFSIVSNPEHFRHMTSAFRDTSLLEEFNSKKSTRKISFLVQRQVRMLQVLQVAKQIENSYIVVSRSGNFPSPSNKESKELWEKEEETTLRSRENTKTKEEEIIEMKSRGDSQLHRRSHSGNTLKERPDSPVKIATSTMYLYGYYIEPTETHHSRVTVLISTSPELVKLLTDTAIFAKLVTFIEELMNLTSALKVQEDMTKRVEKFKSMVAGTFKNKSTEGLESEEVVDPSSVAPFVGDNYIDRIIQPKQIAKIEIPFTMGGAFELNWEIISQVNDFLYFGIEFMPSDPTFMGFERNKENWILYPTVCVQCYSKPCCGRLPLQDFPNGKFIIIFDNSTPLIKTVKNITTRCWIRAIDYSVDSTVVEAYSDITIPRKGYFKFSFYLSGLEAIELTWNLVAGDILFGIFYQEQEAAFEDAFSVEIESLPSKEPTKKTLMGKANLFLGKAKEAYKDVRSAYKEGDPQLALSSFRKDGIEDVLHRFFTAPQKLLVSPYRISSKSEPVTGSVDIKGQKGLYTVLLDNTQSVVTGKNAILGLHCKIKETSV